MEQFEILYQRAIEEWPATIAFRIQRLSRDRHIVRGLTDFSEEVMVKHHDTPDEEVLGHMHWAIVTAIHQTAEHWPMRTLRFSRTRLNKNLVRTKFESDLAFVENEAAAQSDDD